MQVQMLRARMGEAIPDTAWDAMRLRRDKRSSQHLHLRQVQV